jgi:hypothetical protein
VLISKKKYFMAAVMSIDSSQLVVEVDGAFGLACMKPTLEALMKNPEELV